MPSDRNAFHWPATEKTPAISMDQATGELRMEGCSIPENADAFFGPLFLKVEAYCTGPAPETTVHITLTYFNSSSSKYLLDLFKLLEDLHATGRSNVRVLWHHMPDDLDMEEAGQDYRSLLEFPVELVALR
jgi:hypothetical protein